MKTFLKTGVYLCLVCPHFFAVSNPITSIDPQELERLFQPIHQSVRDKAYRENNYSIKRATYFSKRHRIVEADLDLLAEKSGPFLLNPFEIKPCQQMNILHPHHLPHPDCLPHPLPFPSLLPH